MSIRFIAQPTRDQIGTDLLSLLGDTEITNARFLVAWAKYSGLRRLESEILRAKDRGLDIEIVVGVDEGGATVQGLEALLPLANRAWVFHNPARPKRTFHPKIYLFDGPTKRAALVGSGNLTSGGLFGNYEAATIVHSSPSSLSNGERRYIEDATDYYERIRDDPHSSRVLTQDLIATLRADRTIIVGDERSRRPRGTPTPDVGAPSVGIFERSLQSLLPIPRPIDREDGELGEDDDDGVALDEYAAEIAATESSAEAGALQTARDGRGFYKRLSKWDLSHTSSPGQIVVPMRFLEFFEPLEDQNDRTEGAAVQRGRDNIEGIFHDGDTESAVQARVILYTPAPHHARSNSELRFTLRDRALFDRLDESDYLEFDWDERQVLHVTRNRVERSSNFGWAEGRTVW